MKKTILSIAMIFLAIAVCVCSALELSKYGYYINLSVWDKLRIDLDKIWLVALAVCALIAAYLRDKKVYSIFNLLYGILMIYTSKSFRHSMGFYKSLAYLLVCVGVGFTIYGYVLVIWHVKGYAEAALITLFAMFPVFHLVVNLKYIFYDLLVMKAHIIVAIIIIVTFLIFLLIKRKAYNLFSSCLCIIIFALTTIVGYIGFNTERIHEYEDVLMVDYCPKGCIFLTFSILLACVIMQENDRLLSRILLSIPYIGYGVSTIKYENVVWKYHLANPRINNVVNVCRNISFVLLFILAVSAVVITLKRRKKQKL